MMDANQAWDVGEAIANIQQLAKYQPWWIEEPTSPMNIQTARHGGKAETSKKHNDEMSEVQIPDFSDKSGISRNLHSPESVSCIPNHKFA
jgi:hypothetical protein